MGGKTVEQVVTHKKMRLAMGWTVRGSYLGRGARFSDTIQISPGAHPASNIMGTGSLSWGGGVKRPGVALTTHPPTSAEVKERVELYLYSPLWAFMVCFWEKLVYFYIN